MHDSHVECTVREELQRLKSLPFFFGFWWERKRKKRKYIYVHIYIYISLLCYSIFYILQVVIDGINVNVLQGLVRRVNNWVVRGLKRGSLHGFSSITRLWLCLSLSQINIFSFFFFFLKKIDIFYFRTLTVRNSK